MSRRCLLAGGSNYGMTMVPCNEGHSEPIVGREGERRRGKNGKEGGERKGGELGWRKLGKEVGYGGGRWVRNGGRVEEDG